MNDSENEAWRYRPADRFDFQDPWGNHFQVVDYRDVQFTKTAAVLRGMRLEALDKSEQAVAELRAKGLAAD